MLVRTVGVQWRTCKETGSISTMTPQTKLAFLRLVRRNQFDSDHQDSGDAGEKRGDIGSRRHHGTRRVSSENLACYILIAIARVLVSNRGRAAVFLQ